MGSMGYFGVCRYLVLELIPIDVIDGNLTLENDSGIPLLVKPIVPL